MKIAITLISFVAISFVAMTSLASQITYVQGNGNSNAYCNYTGGTYCIDGAKANAERDAQSRAEQNCRMSQGQPLTYTSYCSSSCSPNTLAPGDNNVSVRCSSGCRMQCQIN